MCSHTRDTVRSSNKNKAHIYILNMKTTFTQLMLLVMLCLGIQSKAQNEFITRWNLSNAGSSATTLSLGLSMSGTVNYTWTTVPAGTSGNGTFSSSASQIIGLPAGTIVRVSLDPTNINSMSMGAGFADKARLVDVEQWGSVAWTTMANMFAGATNLQISASDVPDLSNVTSTGSMFRDCAYLNSPSNIGSWNLSQVTNVAGMFYGASTFNQDISNWDVAAVVSMASMFEGATAFNQNISAWNIHNVTDMSSMFAGASSFDQDMGIWASHLDSSVVMINCFDHTGISVTNYDATLTAFSAYAPSGIQLGVAGLHYCTASTARDNMTSNDSWLIIGDTPGPGFTVPAFASMLSHGCLGAALPTVSDNGIPGTWSPAHVTASVTNYTFVPASGQCAPTTTVGLTINAPAAPAFTVPTTMCSATAISGLPTVSNNGINGTWAPAFSHTVSRTYTFTPSNGQCANSSTLSVHMTQATLPVFAASTPVCAGTNISVLNPTSINGITGVWTPAMNNTITTTYTFTPNSGQCAYTTSVTQVINQIMTPSFSLPSVSCAGVLLPLTSDNSVTGKWMPSTATSNVNTYTFTPDPGQCVSAPTTTVSFVAYSPVSAITMNGSTITANETGATYQWVDCANNNMPIANATGRSFTPTVGGNYAVVITKNGCSTTSPCQSVSLITGIASYEKNSQLVTLSPNPNQGVFQISTSAQELGTVVIYNSLGEVVYSANVKEKSTSVDLSSVNAGIYVVQTIADQKTTSQRVIIGH